MNDDPKSPMHPVDVVIITDWLMPDDDEPMTWDERDGRYAEVVAEDEPDDDPWSDLTWGDYQTQFPEIPKFFSINDADWLETQSPTPVAFAQRLDRIIANTEAIYKAGIILSNLWFHGVIQHLPATFKQEVIEMTSLGYYWNDVSSDIGIESHWAKAEGR